MEIGALSRVSPPRVTSSVASCAPAVRAIQVTAIRQLAPGAKAGGHRPSAVTSSVNAFRTWTRTSIPSKDAEVALSSVTVIDGAELRMVDPNRISAGSRRTCPVFAITQAPIPRTPAPTRRNPATARVDRHHRPRTAGAGACLLWEPAAPGPQTEGRSIGVSVAKRLTAS